MTEIYNKAQSTFTEVKLIEIEQLLKIAKEKYAVFQTVVDTLYSYLKSLGVNLEEQYDNDSNLEDKMLSYILRKEDFDIDGVMMQIKNQVI